MHMIFSRTQTEWDCCLYSALQNNDVSINYSIHIYRFQSYFAFNLCNIFSGRGKWASHSECDRQGTTEEQRERKVWVCMRERRENGNSDTIERGTRSLPKVMAYGCIVRISFVIRRLTKTINSIRIRFINFPFSSFKVINQNRFVSWHNRKRLFFTVLHFPALNQSMESTTIRLHRSFSAFSATNLIEWPPLVHIPTPTTTHFSKHWNCHQYNWVQ